MCMGFPVLLWACNDEGGGPGPASPRLAGVHALPCFPCAPGRRCSGAACSILVASGQHDGSLPGAKRLLASGACSVWKGEAGDPLQLDDVNHKEAFLKHNGFSFLSDTKDTILFFFFFNKARAVLPPMFPVGAWPRWLDWYLICLRQQEESPDRHN